MELHRLTPMKPHDPKLFNTIYKKTEGLRHVLVNQIDASRFGVTRDEVMSWMDDKLIFVFNKYVDTKSPDLLLGYVINSLKVFKLKILRRSYQLNNSVNLNSIALDDIQLNYIKDEVEEDNYDLMVNLVMEFMENRLSQEAFTLLQIQLNPPLYITSKVKNPLRIPLNIILEFLGLDITPVNLSIVKELQFQINQCILEAKDHFRDYSFA